MHPEQERADYPSTHSSQVKNPDKQGELARELAKLHKVTDILSKRWTDFESRLAPVVRSEIGENGFCGTPEESTNTLTASSIAEARRRVEVVISMLSSVSDRLEV